MKSWLEKNSIEMYSVHAERKPIIAERFIIALKSTIYKYITSIPENVYVDKLHDTVNKYHNKCHRTIKMKPVGVDPSIYNDLNKDTYKYKNIFAKGYVPNWLEEDFVITKIKNTGQWTYVIIDLKGEKIVGKF